MREARKQNDLWKGCAANVDKTLVNGDLSKKTGMMVARFVLQHDFISEENFVFWIYFAH